MEKKEKENKKYKISEESAQVQIDLLLDCGAVEIEDITSEDLKHAISSSLNVLRRAVRRGLLEIKIENGDTQIIQHLIKIPGKSITYKEMDGQAKIEMGKVTEDNPYYKAFALLGFLSGLGADGIAKLKGADLSLAESLSAVFLGI